MYYVYYLLSEKEQSILYIGRSHRPRVRQTSFHRRTGLRTLMGLCQKFSDFKRACQAEIMAIEKHKPHFNLRLISSPGAIGKSHTVLEETKRKMSKAHAGVPKSEEHRLNISKAHQGKVFTQEHRTNISKAKKNPSTETRAKIAASSLGRTWSQASKEKLKLTILMKKKGGI